MTERKQNKSGSGETRLSGSHGDSMFLFATLGLSAGLFFFPHYFSSFTPNPDALYHLGCAKLYLEKGWLSVFPWMQATELAEHFTNTYLLTQLALIPAALAPGDPLTALAITNIILSLAIIASLALVLKRFSIPMSSLVAFFAIGASSITVLRLCSYKGTLLFTSVWIWCIYFIAQGRHRALFVLSMISVYMYTGFPLLIATALSHAFAVLVNERKLAYKPTVAVFVGYSCRTSHQSFLAAPLVFLLGRTDRFVYTRASGCDRKYL